MPTIMKGVCPKCKAKFKFDADKITSGVVKSKCPGCASVLRIRKPDNAKEQPLAAPPGRLQPAAAMDKGSEMPDSAGDLEMAMDDRAEEQEKAAGGQDDGKDAAARTQDDDAGNRSREFKRVKFKKKVLVNNQIMVEALDISENGLFLHTGRSFDDGAVVEVGIPTLPGTFDLKIQAVVKHNHRGIGMGLQFVDLDDRQVVQLHKLISELDAAAAQEPEGRRKILLVGGTDTSRNINKSKLVLDGFYVLQATTPEEVFHILKNEPPDAMILEWQETAFNCKGLLAQIKETPQFDPVIRVVLAALTDVSVQRDIIAAGAHRCMAKMDTNPARLSQVLKQLIAERDG